MARKHSEDDFDFRVKAGTSHAQRYLEEYQDSMESSLDRVVRLAGCSLAKTPGKDNWVDHAGGLPEAICEMAKDIRDGGHDTSSAIAIAVSQAKKLAATSKDPKIRAKYSKAVAEWEAMKAKVDAKKD